MWKMHANIWTILKMHTCNVPPGSPSFWISISRPTPLNTTENELLRKRMRSFGSNAAYRVSLTLGCQLADKRVYIAKSSYFRIRIWSQRDPRRSVCIITAESGLSVSLLRIMARAQPRFKNWGCPSFPSCDKRPAPATVIAKGVDQRGMGVGVPLSSRLGGGVWERVVSYPNGV